MIKLDQHQMVNIAPLFSHSTETMIFTCLQGHMGTAWADNADHPTCAQIVVADMCFFAGNAKTKESEALVRNLPPKGFNKDTIYVIPLGDEWCELIEAIHPNGLEKFSRYAIKKEGDSFNRDRLRAYIKALPPEYTLKRFDEALYHMALDNAWSRDLCANFATAADYIKRGRGYGILHNGLLVSGASSYTVYDDGIEIEIDTLESYRRKGLALVCGAALVLDCIEHGLYPSWDAANTASVALSEKLGYHFDKEYTTYAIHFS